MSYRSVKFYSQAKAYRPNSSILAGLTIMNIDGINAGHFYTNTSYRYAQQLTPLGVAYACISGSSYLHNLGGNNSGYDTIFMNSWGNEYSYAYEDLTPIDYSVIACVQIVKASTLITDSLFYYPVENALPAGKVRAYESPYTTNVVYAGVDAKIKYGEYYVVTDVKLYNNSNDGNITPSNPRPVIPKSDLYGRLSFTAVVKNDMTDVIGGDGDMLLPIYGTFFDSKNFDDFSTDGTPTGIACHNALKGAMTICASNTNDFFNSLVGGKACYKLFSDLNTLKGQLSSIGIPFTFSEVEATGANSTYFNDYTAPGQPIDDIGGGSGDGDNSNDGVENETPNVTTISSFNNQFAMSQNQLTALSTYLWTADFLDNIKLLFNDPAEAVVSCHMYPFSITEHNSANVGALEGIKIGNVLTTVEGYPIRTGYNCIFSLGSISLAEYYGTAMDYEPYTSISIYLPYLGIKSLSTNDVMGKTINVKYIVDITTGACTAQIWSGDMLLYIFDGKIGIDIPLSSTNASQRATAMALAGISGIAGVATGIATANPLIVAGSVISTAKSVASNQLHVNRGGINSPATGLYMPQQAYLIIERPVQSLASSFGAVRGFPCNVTKVLGSVTGYTEVETPIITNIVATAEEIVQIKNLLETGVIIS